MSEQETLPEGTAAPETDAEAASQGAGSEGDPAATSEPEETFDRAYVERLRRESAEYRTRARRAEELESRLSDAVVREGAAGVLEDPDDLLRHREADDLLDDDGFPDVEKVRSAARELVATKPHLTTRRPEGESIKARGPSRPARSTSQGC
ncbi:MAG: hypothetical protein WD096_01330 [Actinomycetota bacterium]